MIRQGAGDATENAPQPTAAPASESTAPAASGEPVASTPAPVPPKPAPASTPAGPTRDAQITHQELPSIPEYLKDSGYATSVRVRVEVSPDGSFTPVLRTSSGNPDVDLLVLQALKRWKWQPALKDGIPIASTEPIRFDFAVN